MSPIQPCMRETIAVAVRGRPDWSEQEVENAVFGAYPACSPGRVLMEIVRLMAIEDSEPRDLNAAVTRPSGWRSPGSGVPKPARTRREKTRRG
jgi:hypothetical protein